MQPGRARTSGLGVPLLPLARWVGWVAPVRPTHGVLGLSCPSAALRVCSVLGRWAPVHRCARAVCCGASVVLLGQLAPVHRCARSVCCVACAVSWAPGLLFTGVRAVCGARVPWVDVSLFLPPKCSFFFFCFFFFLFFFFFFEKRKRKNKKEENRGAGTLQAQAWAAGAAVL